MSNLKRAGKQDQRANLCNLALGKARKEGGRESLNILLTPHPAPVAYKLLSLTPSSYLPPACQANLHLAPKVMSP